MVIPNNLRVASEYDFFNPDNKLIIGLKFHVHTYHSNKLEEHVVVKGMDLEKWRYWLDDRRIYILDDRTKLSNSPTSIDHL